MFYYIYKNDGKDKWKGNVTAKTFKNKFRLTFSILPLGLEDVRHIILLTSDSGSTIGSSDIGVCWSPEVTNMFCEQRNTELGSPLLEL